MTDKYSHLEWIADIVRRSVKESPDGDILSIYASEFANFSGAEKRDIFLYLLGDVVNRND